MIGAVLRRSGRVYKSVCGGDSGGPLFYYDSRARKYVLIGKWKYSEPFVPLFLQALFMEMVIPV